MSYYNDLSYELRRRGFTDERIAEVIEEAQQHCSISGESPHEAFGKPSDYASNFPSVGRPRTSRGLLNTGGLLVVLIFAIQIVGLSQGHDLRLGAVPFYVLGLPVLVVFILAAFIQSHRVPRKEGVR